MFRSRDITFEEQKFGESDESTLLDIEEKEVELAGSKERMYTFIPLDEDEEDDQGDDGEIEEDDQIEVEDDDD